MFSVFGWYGFRLRHPHDWAPTTISGARNEGYARLSSSGALALQIRWKKLKGTFSGETWIQNYFRKLEADSKRIRAEFRRESKQVDDNEYEYRWVGQGQGRGYLFLDQSSARVFFLEVTGDRSGDMLTHIRNIRTSFSAESDNNELWSVFGLQLLLPPGLLLESKKFESGRTRLCFKKGLNKIEAERWALGQQLIAKHGLEPWARSSIGWKNPACEQENQRIKLEGRSMLGQKREALIEYQEGLNQICVVRSSYRNPKWRPKWDWLAESVEW